MSPSKAGSTSVALVALALALAGCRLNLDEGKNDGPVVRYSGQETSMTGALVLTSEVAVRRAADSGAQTIQVLPPGTQVRQQAQFSGFTLVSFTGPDGSEQSGWIGNEVAATAKPATATNTGKVTVKTPTPVVTTPVATATQTCTGGKVFDGTSCKCPAATSWDGSECVGAAQNCTGGKQWNGSACACPAGSTWNGTNCSRTKIKL